ncbi:hypothetical protein GCM10028775_15890 [Catellatospora paridis]
MGRLTWSITTRSNRIAPAAVPPDPRSAGSMAEWTRCADWPVYAHLGIDTKPPPDPRGRECRIAHPARAVRPWRRR